MSSLSKEKQELLKAVKDGTSKRAKELINSNGLEINDETYFDYRLLKAAFKRKHKTLINFLLTKNCRVRNENETKWTPLHYAVMQEDIATVKKLLAKGASINDSYNGETPLILAVKNSRINKDEIVKVMLSLYDFKNVDPISEQHLVNFHIACDRDDKKAIKNFVKYGFPVNSHAASSKFFEFWNGNTPLHFVVKNHSNIYSSSSDTCNLITYLLENGADYTLTNSERQTPVHLAYSFEYDAINIITTIFHHSLNDRCINSVDNNGLTHLHICCAKNMPEVVEKFLENGEDINFAVSLDSDKNAGYTPLHFAVENCHASIVIILLNHGADVSLKCKKGSTPLHLACKLGELGIIRLLLHFNAGLTVRDNKGCIPLHCAFYEVPMDDLVNLLLAQIPKKVNYTDSEGLSILHIACARNNKEIVEHFLEQGVSPNLCIAANNYKYPGFTPMHFAAEYNRQDMVQLLFKYGADLNRNENLDENGRQITPLHMSCLHSHKKFYEVCRAKHIDWKFQHKNHIDVVKLLLQHKAADVNAKDSLGKTPLVYLCELSKSPLIDDYSGWKRYYTKNDESFEKMESSSNEEEEESKDIRGKVLKEVKKRIIDIACIFISYNVDLNACTDIGESILHVIIKYGYDLSKEIEIELVNLFLKNNANVQMADQKKITPLHIAVGKKKRYLVDIFLNYNANINAKTVKLMTPLHVAAASDYDANYHKYTTHHPRQELLIAELLLKNGCTVDNQNLEGETALHLAISKLNYPVIKLLLRYGADINCENGYGCPPVFKLKEELRKNYNPHFTIKEILKFLDNHVEKLKLIGLHTNGKSKKRLLELQKKYFAYDYNNTISFECELELKKMKDTKIDQYTNLHNILFKDDIEMSRLIRNKNLKTIVTDDQLENKFPLYGDILKLQFRRGTEKIVILDNAKESLGYVTGFLLPDSCSERIFRYLTTDDLLTLIKVKSEVSYKRKINYDPEESDKSTAKHIRLKE